MGDLGWSMQRGRQPSPCVTWWDPDAAGRGCRSPWVGHGWPWGSGAGGVGGGLGEGVPEGGWAARAHSQPMGQQGLALWLPTPKVAKSRSGCAGVRVGGPVLLPFYPKTAAGEAVGAAGPVAGSFQQPGGSASAQGEAPGGGGP